MRRHQIEHRLRIARRHRGFAAHHADHGGRVVRQRALAEGEDAIRPHRAAEAAEGMEGDERRRQDRAERGAQEWRAEYRAQQAGRLAETVERDVERDRPVADAQQLDQVIGETRGCHVGKAVIVHQVRIGEDVGLRALDLRQHRIAFAIHDIRIEIVARDGLDAVDRNRRSRCDGSEARIEGHQAHRCRLAALPHLRMCDQRGHQLGEFARIPWADLHDPARMQRLVRCGPFRQDDQSRARLGERREVLLRRIDFGREDDETERVGRRRRPAERCRHAAVLQKNTQAGKADGGLGQCVRAARCVGPKVGRIGGQNQIGDQRKRADQYEAHRNSRRHKGRPLTVRAHAASRHDGASAKAS
jgi:hypothetical protein